MSASLLASLMSTLDRFVDLIAFFESADADSFAVPAALAKGADGRTKATVTCGSFEVPALIVPMTPGDKDGLRAALAATLGLGPEDLDVHPCVLKDGSLRIIPFVCPRRADVEIIDKDHPDDDAAERNRRRLAIETYRRTLGLLSAISGRKVVFHSDGSGIRAPFPADGALHLITNAAPPGHFTVRYANLAFGMKIADDGLSVLANGPTKGRGTVLTDQYKEPLVQVLGDNWYLLLPTLSHFNGSSSALIFERLLALAWNAREERQDASAPLTKKAFMETASAWTTDFESVFEGEIKKLDERLIKLQKEMADVIRARCEFLNLQATYRAGAFVKDTLKRLPKDFAAIAGNPLVARVTSVDDGIHVETAPLAAEHDGKRYALGAFVIRISKRGSVSVWSEAPVHKDGIPHPHIAKDGGPCFGNASEAITKAAAEMRLADCVRYVLRWLTEGYTAQLAAVKIEEWPLEGRVDAIDDGDVSNEAGARGTDANAGGMP